MMMCSVSFAVLPILFPKVVTDGPNGLTSGFDLIVWRNAAIISSQRVRHPFLQDPDDPALIHQIIRCIIRWISSIAQYPLSKKTASILFCWGTTTIPDKMSCLSIETQSRAAFFDSWYDLIVGWGFKLGGPCVWRTKTRQSANGQRQSNWNGSKEKGERGQIKRERSSQIRPRNRLGHHHLPDLIPTCSIKSITKKFLFLSYFGSPAHFGPSTLVTPTMGKRTQLIWPSPHIGWNSIGLARQMIKKKSALNLSAIFWFFLTPVVWILLVDFTTTQDDQMERNHSSRSVMVR